VLDERSGRKEQSLRDVWKRKSPPTLCGPLRIKPERKKTDLRRGEDEKRKIKTLEDPLRPVVEEITFLLGEGPPHL